MTRQDFLALLEQHQAILLEPREELDVYIVGAASVDGRVCAVYDTAGLVEWFQDKDNNHDDVREWIDYNVRPASTPGWPILTYP